jgi:fatty-acyl-CoA synthase
MTRRRFVNVTTLGDLIDRAATEHARDALVFPDARLSYAELAGGSTRYARSLYALGVRAGDKVGILMPNQAEFVLVMVAAAKLGAVGVPVNGRFKAHELGYVLPHADITVLVTARGPEEAVDFPGLIAEVVPTLPADGTLSHVVDLSDSRTEFLGRAEFDALAETVDVATITEMQIRVRLRDPALLMYTSGTTAQPKGCLLSHEAIVRQGSSVAETRFELTEADRLWDPLPLFHCGGIVPMIGALSAGATFYHAGHFDPDQSLRTLADERITVAFPAFETIWFGILNHPRRPDVDLSSIRLIMSIATPARLAQFEREMPWARQVSSYGSTESSTNLTLSHPDDPYEARIGTLGTPIEGLEIRIVDPETNVERATDEIGELCFRGYSLFSGYYKDPEATAASFDRDGWFHTGDLGSVDAAGRLIYTGRLKDMLKVGGENVSALEIEDYLARHPAIDIVQVVAAPDAKYTEVPAAFVQLAPGAEVTEQEVIDFCIGTIASFKVPRYVRVVSEWPMSGTKIQKFVLRDWIAAEVAESRQAVS